MSSCKKILLVSLTSLFILNRLVVERRSNVREHVHGHTDKGSHDRCADINSLVISKAIGCARERNSERRNDVGANQEHTNVLEGRLDTANDTELFTLDTGKQSRSHFHEGHQGRHSDWLNDVQHPSHRAVGEEVDEREATCGNKSTNPDRSAHLFKEASKHRRQ